MIIKKCLTYMILINKSSTEMILKIAKCVVCYTKVLTRIVQFLSLFVSFYIFATVLTKKTNNICVCLIQFLSFFTGKHCKKNLQPIPRHGKHLSTHILFSSHTHMQQQQQQRCLSPLCLHDAIFIITSPSLLPLMTPPLLSLILY